VEKKFSRFPYGIEYWAAESVQEQPDQRALMRSHIVRSQVRFSLFVAGALAIVIFSLALEITRFWVGGATISQWRCLGGMVPGLLGLLAMLGTSAAFVRDVYDIPSWRSALGYVRLLLFGRAPLSLLDLRQRPRKGLFSILGLLPPSVAAVAPYPGLIVQEGQIGEKHRDTLLARLGGPGNVVIFNDSAVILERFGRFIRVAGPGAVFLRRFERVREVLDLRPQERSEVAIALTRDGIPVQTEVQVRFQLARPPVNTSPPASSTLRPVYRWAWTRAGQCHFRLINLDTGQQRENHWPEQVMGSVGSTMQAIIASYRLDELLEPYEPDRDPRREITERLQHELDAAARDFGARVLEVRMGALEPTLAEVARQRMATWQAVWKSEARKEKARGEAEAIREQGLARAYAQMEIILALTRGFQEVVEHDMALSAEFVALRFIEALRQAWTRPGGTFISSEALSMLDYLQRLVRRDYTLPSGETGSE